MKQLVILGTGGLAREVWTMIERLIETDEPSQYQLKGWISQATTHNALYGAPILGDDAWAFGALSREVQPVLGVGSALLRERLFFRYLVQGFEFPVLIAPSARVGKRVAVGAGSIIAASTSATTDIQIGQGG